MKFTKFIPIALALTLVSPAFAANTVDQSVQSDPLNETMQFTIADYFDMQKANETLTSENVTISGDYANLTLATQLKFGFDVTTNTNATSKIELSAKANGFEALGGTSSAPILAFYNTNASGDRSVTATEVAAALAGTGGPSSKNVIAFGVEPAIVDVADTGASHDTAALASNKIVYTLRNGKYQFYYSVNNAAEQATFDTNDQAGIYQTTVTLTKL